MFREDEKKKAMHVKRQSMKEGEKNQEDKSKKRGEVYNGGNGTHVT